MVKQVTLTIENEISCSFDGLDRDHLELFVQAYAVYAPNYFFSPLYKIGDWDGKIRYFTYNGQTYNTLIPEIVPAIGKLGYKVKVVDHREGSFFQPAPITEDFFSHRMDKNGSPIKLRDYQVQFSNTLMAAGSGIGVAATSAGKAQPLYSRVMTPTGWKSMGDINVGDEVLAADGTVAEVIGAFPQGKKRIYSVEFHDGSSAHCCEDHLWGVHRAQRSSFVATDSTYEVLSLSAIREILETGKSAPISSRQSLSVPTVAPIEWANPTDVTIPAYVLGAWLSGHSRPLPDSLRPALLDLGLGEDKFIPPMYLTSSLDDRIDLIQGLLDAAGLIDECGVVVTLDVGNMRLALDVQDLIRSVGGLCSIVEPKGEHEPYTLHITHPQLDALFTLREKSESCQRITIHKKIIAVVDTGTECDAQCILIDHPDHLYITDDYTVTHNTFLVGAIVESYRMVGANSIIIVPNTDLIRQTRTELGVLGVETGEYSGKVKDTNGRSIIVSTWQALKNNPTVLNDRQVVVVDETHGAKGNTLQTILTKHCKNIAHRFGVTGTMPEHPSEALAVRCAIGNELAHIQASELIDRGVLASIDIKVMQLVEDLTPQYREYEATYAGGELVDYKTFKETYFPDYTSEKKYLSKNKQRVQWISDHIDGLRTAGSVLVLVQSVEMGKMLADITPNSTFVHGSDDDASRQQAYNLFSSSDDAVVFATYGIASTGLSINRVFNLVLIDVGKSFTRVIQSIGRGLRTAHDKQHIDVWDICSDLKYSRRHLTKRKSMYKTAGYPHKVKKVDYSKAPKYSNTHSHLVQT